MSMNSNVKKGQTSLWKAVTVKEMAGGEAEGLAYGGWLPVNSEPNDPSLVSVDKPPILDPVTIHRDWVSGPLNPWQQSNLILDRQKEGGFLLPLQFFPLQLSPRDIALGGIVLALIVTAVIGQIYVFSPNISC